MSKQIALSEILAEISSELDKAHQKALLSGIATMQFEECEVELAVIAEKNANGGLKVWLLDIGAGAKKTDSNTIKLKFSKIGSSPIQAPAVDAENPAPEIKRQP